MVKRNEYIDDDNLSKLSSLTHLLDNDTHTIKHSPFLTKINLSIS